MRNNKGITLIALVITIIVLLILAGVSIAMLTGENGILTQAQRADDNTGDAEIADKINMALNAEFTNLLADGYFSGGAKGADGAVTTAGDPTDIATANGITGADDTTTGDFRITVNADLTPDTPTSGTAVLTITSNAEGKSSITGNITYVPATADAAATYKINPASYPQ